MNMSRGFGRRIGGVMLGVVVVLAGVVAPAWASDPTTAGRTAGGSAHRSVTVSIPAEKLRSLAELATFTSPAGQRMTAAEAPGCTGDWANISLFVEWWYDTSTRVTFASAADWGGRVACTGMAYMSNSSSLTFRSSRVADGSYQSCGIQGGSANNCGTVLTSGDWGCGGVGACNGVYYATLGLSIDLPAGWSWGTPAPPGCSIEFGGITLLCVFDTGNVTVPAVN